MKKLLIVLLLGIASDRMRCHSIRPRYNEYEAATKRWNAGDYQTAVKMYFALVKEHPYSSRADDALYWAGVTQFLYLGETDKALQTLRLLLETIPAPRHGARRPSGISPRSMNWATATTSAPSRNTARLPNIRTARCGKKASIVLPNVCSASARSKRHGRSGRGR